MKDIKNFPFQELTPTLIADKDSLKKWHSKNQLNPHFLAHVIAYIATRTNFTYTEDKKINSKLYIKDNFPSDDWHRGLYYFLLSEPRGLIIAGKQNSDQYRSYSALVPLILSAHKLMNNIPYSSWSKEGLSLVVNKSLVEAMLWVDEINFSKEELINIRNDGMLIQSGSNMGKYRDPEKSHNLYGIKDPEWNKLPSLLKIMKTQIWVAHPNNRNHLMVLDNENWDSLPEPLEVSEVVKPSTEQFEIYDPWA